MVAAVLFGDLVSIPCQPGPLSHCLIPEQYQIRPPALRPTYTHQRQPGIRQRLVRRPRGDLVSNPHRLITSRRRSRARVPGASSSDDTSTQGQRRRGRAHPAGLIDTDPEALRVRAAAFAG
ncbi:MAG: hypothetical protein EOO27_33965 [Comamonadaceae bacterium]|nr:MAG: hypothetical protein EOO27_33965 [Comamonadaceae bacterium]